MEPTDASPAVVGASAKTSPESHESTVASPDAVAVDPVHHGSHILRDATDADRWEWRRRVRANPTTRIAYRIVVGIVGFLLMVAASVSGPFPGPGGIPLFLLGLAVWASEFEWAHKHMRFFRRQFDRYLGWNRRQKALFWVVFFGVIWAFGYLSLVLFGTPPWLPDWADRWLAKLPGV